MVSKSEGSPISSWSVWSNDRAANLAGDINWDWQVNGSDENVPEIHSDSVVVDFHEERKSDDDQNAPRNSRLGKLKMEVNERHAARRLSVNSFGSQGVQQMPEWAPNVFVVPVPAEPIQNNNQPSPRKTPWLKWICQGIGTTVLIAFWTVVIALLSIDRKGSSYAASQSSAT
eukprot:772103_1